MEECIEFAFRLTQFFINRSEDYESEKKSVERGRQERVVQEFAEFVVHCRWFVQYLRDELNFLVKKLYVGTL